MIRPLINPLFGAMYFWASPYESMALLASWNAGRSNRNAISIHAINPGLPTEEPIEPSPNPTEFPTDVPAPEPHDVPVPEPTDPIPVEPSENPPPRPGQDPQPRPIP